MNAEAMVNELIDGALLEAQERDRRYTLQSTLELCRRLAMVDAFDLDVAAEPGRACAPYWYGVKHDGLRQPWKGRVWCNPPFSDVAPWVERAWGQVSGCHTIAMLLPAVRTDQPWWQKLVEPARDGRLFGPESHRLRTHFLPGRVRFGTPSDPMGQRQRSPPFGCVLLVWGPR